MEVQIRTYNGELHYFDSVMEAFTYAKTDLEVWKISWHEIQSQKRLRFVRVDDNTWKFEPLEIDVENIFENAARESAERQ